MRSAGTGGVAAFGKRCALHKATFVAGSISYWSLDPQLLRSPLQPSETPCAACCRKRV